MHLTAENTEYTEKSKNTDYAVLKMLRIFNSLKSPKHPPPQSDSLCALHVLCI